MVPGELVECLIQAPQAMDLHISHSAASLVHPMLPVRDLQLGEKSSNNERIYAGFNSKQGQQLHHSNNIVIPILQVRSFTVQRIFLIFYNRWH
jgi:hypothetical protein